MYFIVYAKDIEGGLPIRKANRDAHLAFLKSAADVKLHVAGPLLDETGMMMGSTLIVEADSKAVVTNWLADDPYKAAGLTASVDVTAYNWVIGAP